ncbi:phosphoribosylanthranilate isomerase [Sedimentisphaera salicampi]|uniref:N-(5'-phosphoribosyl)anthranilate isomerase n=1 Tax=Sedimentisphaera salicampi TaxID=1941349 RepID=A0A1W6LKS5_9BACT|nr:phosphoribosylanthranilate isomerase [Sedimentisphaera salicampi]ARN56377.1 N-(5'-phosphoribosyl)anthranilate isomerase [Sedimentisphaera salicampi]OXU15263.1 N-(5'-phosphoribosyl)anthranilate isomerase [Sedimentisphaera salicampi]
MNLSGLQVKICGLTNPCDAVRCFEYGASAVGVVSYEKSPRFVDSALAKQIKEAAGERPVVAVTVDKSLEQIEEIHRETGINWFQLHGSETPEFAKQLQEKGLGVIKKLKAFEAAMDLITERFTGFPLLLESGSGELPGGNALEWNWGDSKCISGKRPFLLAGGINEENLTQAISEAYPDGIDLSSAVESSPGVKDMGKVKSLFDTLGNAMQEIKYERKIKRIF